MSKTVMNFLLDFMLLLITIGLVFTSCVLRLVFPPATRAAGWTLWGADYDAWANAQFALLALIVLAIVIHVMLHWTWVCAVLWTRLFRKRLDPQDSTQTLYGVATLILILFLLGGLILAAQMTVQKPRDLSGLAHPARPNRPIRAGGLRGLPETLVRPNLTLRSGLPDRQRALN